MMGRSTNRGSKHERCRALSLDYNACNPSNYCGSGVQLFW